MASQAFDRAAERYRLSELLATIPTDRSELVIGFTPWEEDAQGWANPVRRRRPETAGESRLSRTVWDSPDDPGARVAIDVYECDSAEDAVRTLVEVLAANHLAMVPEGPEAVGLVSFKQPDDLPPAVMMVRANVCLVISSFGTVRLDVVPWAQRLDARVQERPEVTEKTEILGEETRPGKGDTVVVPLAPPWSVGEHGYVKVFSEGGTLELSDGSVAVRGEGDVTVEAYVVEPGRPAYRSRRTITTR